MDLNDEGEFNMALVKKKKKKKTTYNLEAVLGLTSDNNAESTAATSDATESQRTGKETVDNPVADDLDLESFGNKKKKKKKKLSGDLNGTPSPEVTKQPSKNERTKASGEILNDKHATNSEIEIAKNDGDNANLEVDFLATKKKKKYKKKGLEELCSEIQLSTSPSMQQRSDMKLKEVTSSMTAMKIDNESTKSETALETTEQDYTYDDLLKRVFDIMYDKNPDLANGRKSKFIMRPPQVLRVGAKKTSFANFLEIAKTLHRMPKHLLTFVLAELGTSGSMDGNQQLIIKGRFQAKQIENVLRRYIKEYVTCHTCRSPETILQKDTRLFFLQCEACGSRCSVASIKSGFQAVTGKRAALRAKS